MIWSVAASSEQAHIQAGSRSQNQNPLVCREADKGQGGVELEPGGWVTSSGRYTFSPTLNLTGWRKIGPANAKEWNSPFSPQGSTSGGKEAMSCGSIVRPRVASSR